MLLFLTNAKVLLNDQHLMCNGLISCKSLSCCKGCFTQVTTNCSHINQILWPCYFKNTLLKLTTLLTAYLFTGQIY